MQQQLILIYVRITALTNLDLWYRKKIPDNTVPTCI